MERLEDIVAANITELRKSKKWTQSELAEKINYSDKSVSKWERGEGLPDLKVITQMADLFGVSVDCLVTENAAQNQKLYNYPKSENGYRIGVELLAVSVVYLIAATFFFYSTYMELISHGNWMAFVWATPVSALVLSYFCSRWKFRICGIVFRSIFVWTLLASSFLQILVFSGFNVWGIFLIGVPSQTAIILLSLIRHRKN